MDYANLLLLVAGSCYCNRRMDPNMFEGYDTRCL
jgi:hypothetical protein